MNHKNQYSELNASSRQELADFSASLTPKQLAATMPAGWTVAAVLAHLAFWDFRAITLIKKWQVEGINPSPNDVDVVNEATRPFLVALDPAEAVKLTLQIAREMDDLIDSLPADFIHEIETKGQTVKLDRAHHRRMHIAEIITDLGIK